MIIARFAENTLVSIDCTLAVIEPGGTRHTIDAPCHGEDLDRSVFAHKPGFRLMFETFTKEGRVVWIYDTNDGNFGFAFSLDWPEGSERGFAPPFNSKAA